MNKDDPPLKTLPTNINASSIPRVTLGPVTRAPPAPPVSNFVHARAPVLAQRSQFTSSVNQRIPRVLPPVAVYDDAVEDEAVAMEEDHMDIEDDMRVTEVLRVQEERGMTVECDHEVEAMVIVEDSDEEDFTDEEDHIQVEHEEHYVWPDAPTHRRLRYAREVDAIREVFEDDPDCDPAMVSEYADDIFSYMEDLEVRQPYSASSRMMNSSSGGDDAQPGLHGRAERDHMGDASNPC